MKDKIINFETAVLAKEKGLPIFLDLNDNIIGYNLSWKSKNPTYYHVHSEFPKDDEFLYAPTQSLLQKWLREEHKILVESLYSFSMNDFITKVGNLNEYMQYKMYDISYDSYEDALEVGLFEALKLI